MYRWLVQRVRHKRSITLDVGRCHGQQIDRGDDDQEEHSDTADDRWPYRSQTSYRDVDDDQQGDPCDQRTIGIAGDRLNECIVIGAAVEEAPPANEARPHEDEPTQGPERGKMPKCLLTYQICPSFEIAHRGGAGVCQCGYKICRFKPTRLTLVGANRLEASVQDPWTSWGLHTRHEP